jgi:hypothetical protein
MVVFVVGGGLVVRKKLPQAEARPLETTPGGMSSSEVAL